MVFIGLIYALSCSPNIDVTIDAGTLQRAVSKPFPITKGTTELVEVTLEHPTVRMPGGDRIGLEIDARIRWRDFSEIAVPKSQVASDATGSERAQDAISRFGKVVRQLTEVEMLERKGTVSASGALSYEAQERAFYLHEISVDHLRVEGVSATQTKAVRGLAQTVLNEVLESRPVYVLDKDAKQRVAGRLVKDVRVQDDGLIVTFGPNL